MSSEIRDRLYECGVIPVVVIDDAANAVPLARALVAGGIDVVEFTYRTPAASEAIRAIAGSMPDVLLGAGTVLTPAQARDAKDAGAVFGVSPGLNPRVVRAGLEAGLFFIPGVTTASDVEGALELDCKVLKFFPAEPMGGLKYLKSLAAPYNHLGVRYMPLGGVSAKNVRDYLAEPAVLGCGGSWIAKRDRIAEQDWDAITAIAREARDAVRAARSEGR